MSLPSRIRRLERAAPAFMARRAEAAERRESFLRRLPTPFDRWFDLLARCWSSPSCVDYFLPDEAVGSLLRQARLIGATYYEQGGEALCAFLRGQEFVPGHVLQDQEIERLLAWCRMVWVKGSTHPYSPWRQTNWLECELGELSDETRREFEERAGRFPNPFDVLAKDAARR